MITKLKMKVQGDQFLLAIVGCLVIISVIFKWQQLQDDMLNAHLYIEYQQQQNIHQSYLISNPNKSLLSVPSSWHDWYFSSDERFITPTVIKRVPTYLPEALFILAGLLLLLNSMRKQRALKAINKTLRYQAHRDALTGVYNRQKFDYDLKKQISISKRYKGALSVILLDADHFKRVNDTKGHLVGDEVLKGIAKIAQENIRKADMLARWGGEEFVILSPSTDAQGAEFLAEKLRALIESHNFGHQLKVTCSFGVAQLREEGSHETLVNRADIALYKAKTSGRNKVVINREPLSDTVNVADKGVNELRPANMPEKQLMLEA